MLRLLTFFPSLQSEFVRILSKFLSPERAFRTRAFRFLSICHKAFAPLRFTFPGTIGSPRPFVSHFPPLESAICISLSIYPGESRQYSCLMKTKAKDAKGNVTYVPIVTLLDVKLCNKHRSDLKKRSHVEFLFLHSFVTSWLRFFPRFGSWRSMDVFDSVRWRSSLSLCPRSRRSEGQGASRRVKGKVTKVSSAENRWRNFSLWKVRLDELFHYMSCNVATGPRKQPTCWEHPESGDA